MRPELETLASALTEAWRTGKRAPRPSGDAKPQTRAEAYAVQDRIADELALPVAGWKIGAALRAVQVFEGHDGPIVGRLFADRVFIGEATLPAAIYAGYNAEMEYAFRLTQPIAPRGRPYARDEVVPAVNFVPGIEIAGNRFEPGPEKLGTFVSIADNGTGGAFVFGAEIEDWQTIDLEALALEGGLPGRPAEVYKGEMRGDVTVIVTEMINGLMERGISLAAGDYLATGSLIVPMPIPTGETFTARFGDLATLRVTIA